MNILHRSHFFFLGMCFLVAAKFVQEARSLWCTNPAHDRFLFAVTPAISKIQQIFEILLLCTPYIPLTLGYIWNFNHNLGKIWKFYSPIIPTKTGLLLHHASMPKPSIFHLIWPLSVTFSVYTFHLEDEFGFDLDINSKSRRKAPSSAGAFFWCMSRRSTSLWIWCWRLVFFWTIQCRLCR